MTAGPVTGHVPIDPGSAQRPLNEAAGEAGADAGTSFADLLAAMLSPGAAGAQLQAPTLTDAVFERLDAAEMFNETGLFRGAAPLLSADGTQSAAAIGVAAAPGLGPKADFDAVPSASLDPAAAALDDVASALGQVAANSGRAGASGGGVGTTPRAAPGAAPLSLRNAAVALPGIPAQSAAAGQAAGGGGRVSPRTVALVAQLMLAKTGAAAAQVSVQAAEGGISVRARVDKLSREERDRLRADIGELLASHGFASAEIMLNGEAWPLQQGEEN